MPFEGLDPSIEEFDIVNRTEGEECLEDKKRVGVDVPHFVAPLHRGNGGLKHWLRHIKVVVVLGVYNKPVVFDSLFVERGARVGYNHT